VTARSEAYLITVHHNGWGIYFREDGRHSSTLSGYGDDHVEYILGTLGHHPGWTPERRQEWHDRHFIRGDVPVIDTRTCSDDDRFTFAFAGPVPSDVEPGMVTKFGEGNVEFDPRPVFGRPPANWFLGNAYGLDYVGPDVYGQIAAKIGATITTAGDIRRQHAEGTAA
jgi:hypothetical protein